MKISASIYSAANSNLSSLVHELDAYQSDFFHIDCNDKISVFDDIKAIKKYSQTPIDLHLITDSPENYFDLIREVGISSLTIQYENISPRKIEIPDDLNCEIGIAITSDTDISVFDQYASKVNHILFMTTTPGKSGEPFNVKNFRKIRDFRFRYPEKKIHVDGGINAELSFILRNMGVYLVVVGSYLLRQEFIGSAMMKLRSDNIGSAYEIKDFMLQYDEIPILCDSNFDFLEMLLIIEHHKMGFVNVIDNNKKLLGIISNADVRRALIKKWKDMPNLSLKDVMNMNPIVINQNSTVNQLLSHIKSLSFPILFIPVVDDSGKLCGTVKFNNLIRGEL